MTPQQRAVKLAALEKARAARWPQKTTTPTATPAPRRLCSACGRQPLGIGNRSGVCTPCQVAPKTPPAVDVPVLPVVRDLPDDYLVACVAEARRRADAIVADAEARSQKLLTALGAETIKAPLALTLQPISPETLIGGPVNCIAPNGSAAHPQ